MEVLREYVTSYVDVWQVSRETFYDEQLFLIASIYTRAVCIVLELIAGFQSLEPLVDRSSSKQS